MSAIFVFIVKQKVNKINVFQNLKLLQKCQNYIPITHRLPTVFFSDFYIFLFLYIFKITKLQIKKICLKYNNSNNFEGNQKVIFVITFLLLNYIVSLNFIYTCIY